jgi:hypothetical protein
VRPGFGVVSASTEGGSPLDLLHRYHANISAPQRQPQVLVPYASPLLSQAGDSHVILPHCLCIAACPPHLPGQLV